MRTRKRLPVAVSGRPIKGLEGSQHPKLGKFVNLECGIDGRAVEFMGLRRLGTDTSTIQGYCKLCFSPLET